MSGHVVATTELDQVGTAPGLDRDGPSVRTLDLVMQTGQTLPFRLQGESRGLAQSIVPEPSAALLLALGGIAALRRVRR